jgi:serine/threonine protein kinase
MDPARFGKYRLQERIALGGMAEVFRAVAEGPAGVEKVVALKRILPLLSGAGDFVTMFIDEARIAASLTHVNIAQVLEFGEVGGQYYLAMELVEGADLARLSDAARARGRRLPVEVVDFVVAEAARGLAYAHDKRGRDGAPLAIVHRDVSPQNILVSFAGEVKLADFGIAKAIGKLHKTESGAVMGKLRYMSPEQVLGEPLDARSDLFALGVVMHEMLTGKTLFDGDNPGRVAEQIKTCEVPPPSATVPEVPAALDQVCLKLLQRKPADRYQHAAEVARDLAKLPSVSREDLGALVQELAPRPTEHVEASAPTVAMSPTPPQDATRPASPSANAGANAPTRADRRRPGPRRWVVFAAIGMAPLAAGVAWMLSAPPNLGTAHDLGHAADAAVDAGGTVAQPGWPRIAEADRVRLASELTALPLENATRRGVPNEDYEAVLSAVDGALCSSANPAEPQFAPETVQRLVPLRLEPEARALARYLLAAGELPPEVDGPYRSFLGRNPAFAPGPPSWSMAALASVTAPSPERFVDLMRQNTALKRWHDHPPDPTVRFGWLCDRASVVDAYAKLAPGARTAALRRFLSATPSEAAANVAGLRAQLTGDERDEAAGTLKLTVRLTNPSAGEKTLNLADARLSGVDDPPQVAPPPSPLAPGGSRDVTLTFPRVTDAAAEAAVLVLGPGAELQAHSELLK